VLFINDLTSTLCFQSIREDLNQFVPFLEFHRSALYLEKLHDLHSRNVGRKFPQLIKLDS